MRRMDDQETFADLPILGELRERLRSEYQARSSPRGIGLRRWPFRRTRLTIAIAGTLILAGSAAAAVVSLFPGEPPLSPGAVILARGRGPEGDSYELAVAASRCPGWVRLEVRSTSGYSGGDCGEPLNETLLPRVTGGGGGKSWESMEGTVSSKAHSVRVALAGGGSITAPVYPIPQSIAKGAGAFLFFANRSIEHAVAFQSLDASGRVLASGPAPPSGLSHPVASLAPGIVTVARGRLPHGTPFAITLQRIRFLGKLDLCLTAGKAECPPYPVRERAPVFLLGVDQGSCSRPRYQLLAGLLLHAGLAAWLQTPAGAKKLKHVAVPSSFRVPGGLFYGILSNGPATLLIRNRHAADVYSAPVLRPVQKRPCGGLDPATSDGARR